MGVDLLDFYRGEISLRRLVVFTQNLPKDGEVVKELLFREEGELTFWDEKAYLLADILDEVRVSNYIGQCLMQRGAKNPSKPNRPKPAYRPKKSQPKPELPPLPQPSEFAGEDEINSFIQTYQPNVAPQGGEVDG